MKTVLTDTKAARYFQKAMAIFGAYFGYYSSPSFIVLGAQKAGTTSLYHILEQHPNITPSLKKEINFFNVDDRYNKGIGHYGSYFPIPCLVQDGNLLFEASPQYIFDKNAPYRLSSYNKNLKYILLLREPSSRALSAWTMYHHHFLTGKFSHLHDPRSFTESIETELEDLKQGTQRDKVAYIERGIYVDQLKRYFEVIPRENLLIVESTELQLDLQETTRRICNFLDIKHIDLESRKANSRRVSNNSDYDAELKLLRDFYRPHNERLYSLLGRRFLW